jgi:hypothetical protein
MALCVVVVALDLAVFGSGRASSEKSASPPPFPRFLTETGLYLDGDVRRLDPETIAYSPDHALWSDGATKRRFIRLPAGARIDASNPDRWSFPAGTRFWKEFSFAERAETRLIERLPDGTFRYATYVWNTEGTNAELAPESGRRAVTEAAPGVTHDAPSQADCQACHEGRPGRILGFNAVSLAQSLRTLAERDLFVGLSPALVARPPRIEARDDLERAALGYLFANCAGCHNGDGPLAAIGLDFDVLVANGVTSGARRTAFDRPSNFRMPGHEAARRIAPGRPAESVVLLRMRSRDPLTQMPPLGTRIADGKGIELIERFVAREHD